jgi:type I restriction-modification system DNA methylase subunit
MAIKKSDLYSSLWASCDELRGGMDASQYKDYVLFMLFIKYVSDKYADYDGFEPPVVIPPGASFRDMVARYSAKEQSVIDNLTTQLEAVVLRQWLKLNVEETDLKKSLRDAEADLDRLAYEKYPTLTEADIQTLVVDDKWLKTLVTAVQGEIDRVSQTLTGRIRTLADRYATPLPQLTNEVAALAAKVDGHLQRMGASL